MFMQKFFSLRSLSLSLWIFLSHSFSFFPHSLHLILFSNETRKGRRKRILSFFLILYLLKFVLQFSILLPKWKREKKEEGDRKMEKREKILFIQTQHVWVMGLTNSFLESSAYSLSFCSSSLPSNYCFHSEVLSHLVWKYSEYWESRKRRKGKSEGEEEREKEELKGICYAKKYCNAWISNTSVDPQSISSLSLSLSERNSLFLHSSKMVFTPHKFPSESRSRFSLPPNFLLLSLLLSFPSPFLHLLPSLNILLLPPSSNFVFKISILIPSKRNWPLFSSSKQFSHCLFLFWIRHRIGDPICFSFFLSLSHSSVAKVSPRRRDYFS